MIELKSTRKLEEAYGVKLDRVLADALQSCVYDFRVQCNKLNCSVRVLDKNDSYLHIEIGCSTKHFKDFIQSFRTCYLTGLVQQLELSTSERISLGEVFHKRGIGNNSSYPIYVLTKTRKILVGYLNSNQDVVASVRYIYIENTKKERVFERTIRLKALY